MFWTLLLAWLLFGGVIFAQPGSSEVHAMSASPIPKTAPFADDEIDILNRVVGPATPIQRAWLAGFLAGLDASAGRGRE